MFFGDGYYCTDYYGAVYEVEEFLPPRYGMTYISDDLENRIFYWYLNLIRGYNYYKHLGFVLQISDAADIDSSAYFGVTYTEETAQEYYRGKIVQGCRVPFKNFPEEEATFYWRVRVKFITGELTPWSPIYKFNTRISQEEEKAKYMLAILPGDDKVYEKDRKDTIIYKIFQAYAFIFEDIWRRLQSLRFASDIKEALDIHIKEVFSSWIKVPRNFSFTYPEWRETIRKGILASLFYSTEGLFDVFYEIFTYFRIKTLAKRRHVQFQIYDKERFYLELGIVKDSYPQEKHYNIKRIDPTEEELKRRKLLNMLAPDLPSLGSKSFVVFILIKGAERYIEGFIPRADTKTTLPFTFIDFRRAVILKYKNEILVSGTDYKIDFKKGIITWISDKVPKGENVWIEYWTFQENWWKVFINIFCPRHLYPRLVFFDSSGLPYEEELKITY